MVVNLLGERFQASGGKPVEWAGHLVHMVYELIDLADGFGMRIDFSPPSPHRPQGLVVKSRDGDLESNGVQSDDLVFWSDSSPSTVFVRFRSGSEGQPMSVRIWNVWRDEGGPMHAWIGHAGIRVKDQDSGVVVLRCSDGYDEPTFTDLVARIELLPPPS